MEDRAIAEVLSALNQMEAEDRAEDAQRRGRVKLKMVVEGFAQVRKEMPALEERKLALITQIAGLDQEFAVRKASKQREAEKEIQAHSQRMFTAKTKADEWTKKVTDLGVQLANAQAALKPEQDKWDVAIAQKKAEFAEAKREFDSFLKKRGLAATG